MAPSHASPDHGPRGDASAGGGGTLPVAGETPNPDVEPGAGGCAFAVISKGMQRVPPPGASWQTSFAAGASPFSHRPVLGLQTVPYAQTAKQPPAARCAPDAPSATLELTIAAGSV